MNSPPKDAEIVTLSAVETPNAKPDEWIELPTWLLSDGDIKRLIKRAMQHFSQEGGKTFPEVTQIMDVVKSLHKLRNDRLSKDADAQMQ